MNQPTTNGGNPERLRDIKDIWRKIGEDALERAARGEGRYDDERRRLDAIYLEGYRVGSSGNPFAKPCGRLSYKEGLYFQIGVDEGYADLNDRIKDRGRIWDDQPDIGTETPGSPCGHEDRLDDRLEPEWWLAFCRS